MSPPSARELLGKRLRRYRTEAKLLGADLAELLGTSQSRISRIEAGKTQITADEVQQWLGHTHAPQDVYDELAELVERAEAQLEAWKELNRGGFAKNQKRYDTYDRQAIRTRIYQAALVPGLMQSPAYCTYVLRELVRVPTGELDAAVAGRLARQAVLYEPSTQLDVVVTESVLRHQMGGPGVMLEQLGRIADVARLPTVNFGVIPLDTDMPETYGVSFILREMPEDAESTSTVTVELAYRELKETNPEAVAEYSRRYEVYQDAALKGKDAIDLVKRIATELTTKIFKGQNAGRETKGEVD